MEYDELRDLLRRNRTYRRFDGASVGADTLERLVELTRYCASGRNLQPLRYRLVTDADECASVYRALAWAGYYKDWDGPAEGERPGGYLVQCLDTRLTTTCLCDDGLQLEAITLGATTLRLGCCIIKSFNVVTLRQALGLAEYFKPLYVVALGKPAETVVLETADGAIEYYRDAVGNHHVPKRELRELLIGVNQ